MLSYRRVFVAAFSLILVISLAVGITLAQSNGPEEQEPATTLSIEATLGTGFFYQGRLKNGNRPASGVYDFRFRLYTAQNGGTQVGTPVTRSNVLVSNGLFAVVLDFGASAFTGETRWLQVEVKPGLVPGQYIVLSPRQPIYAVPYALTVRPGATVRTGSAEAYINYTQRSGFVYRAYGLYGKGGSGNSITWAYGVAGETNDGKAYGGIFLNNASNGAALYARSGSNSAPDIILGSNSGNADDGVIASAPNDSDSDIILRTNDAVVIQLDADKSGDDADFEVLDKNGKRLFNVDESGAVISALPRPAYDSGWVSVAENTIKQLTHSLGGNPDNYVVNLVCKDNTGGTGINQFGYGSDIHDDGVAGVVWSNLTSQSIIVRRYESISCAQIRVRIWVYK